MLDPSLVGREQPGFHLTLQNSVQRCDVDLRTSLYGNIILAGKFATQGLSIKVRNGFFRDKNSKFFSGYCLSYINVSTKNIVPKTFRFDWIF